MIPPAFVLCGIGLVTTVLSIPLVLRKVPRNGVYGVRIPKAFESDGNWYEINAYGGRLLLGYGLFLVAFGLLGRPYAPSPRSIWTVPFIVGSLLLLIPILARIVSYARRLP